MDIARRFPVLLLLIALWGCQDDPEVKSLSLLSARVGSTYLSQDAMTTDIPTTHPVVLAFSSSVEVESATAAISLTQNDVDVAVALTFTDNDRTVTINPAKTLAENTTFTLHITNALKGSAGEVFPGTTFEFKTSVGRLRVVEWRLGGEVPDASVITDIPLDLDFQIQFSDPVNPASVNNQTITLRGSKSIPLQFQLSDNGTQLTVTSEETLRDLARFTLTINDALTGEQEEAFTGLAITFYTAIDPDPDHPVISDDALLTLVQKQTFKYFYDFAHPASGMARERNSSGSTVTSGGSGFGIMALIVGIERNFITRSQGLAQMDKILTFLETADRFHGAWAHWMNGDTGKAIPFSANDNGGDLVETSFLIQGLLTFRQYLDEADAQEKTLIDRINALWHSVEWDWYTRDGQHVLYWHWSPDKGWAMNHPIRGYDEALITYFLAAASPTHTIDAVVYHEGWAGNGSIANGKSFYDIELPLGYDYGGPLFFAHYSFLGLDPRGLEDTYADYWMQNVNHTLINHAYGVANPKNYVGYSDENWGLTASDNHNGYSAHSPTNDLGVITPTAALSSFPYTPELSMKALKFFYYTVGDRLWGEYGFHDAFNITEDWTADSYLAIDQGPIIVMIENYRTGLLWNLFMSCPEVTTGMDKLGFTR